MKSRHVGRKRSAKNIMITVMIIAGIGVDGGWSQTASGDKSHQDVFAVASMKLSPPGSGFTILSPPGERVFTAKNVLLAGLLVRAFDISEMQIVGLPGWSGSVRYDVTAEPPGTKPFNQEELEHALQNLLVGRLHLVFHRDTKEARGYGLVIGAGTSKLKISQGGVSRVYMEADGLTATNINLQQLCNALQLELGFPVENDTGFTQNVDLSLKFARNNEPESSLPSIYTALREQLGLRLVDEKVKTPVIVVDHVDRVPTEN